MTLLRPYARVLFVALALTPCVARAEAVGFSYGWSIAGGDISASGPGPISLSQTTAPDGSGVTVNYGSGSTTLTVASAGTAATTPGGADYFSATPATIPLGTLTPLGTTGPFNFYASNTLTLTLTDTASGQSGSISLAGSVSHDISYTGPTLGVSAYPESGQVLTLGGHQYSVDNVYMQADLIPGMDPLSLVAQVYIDRPAPDYFPPIAFNGGSVASVPEPSSLLLAGVRPVDLGRGDDAEAARPGVSEAIFAHPWRSSSANRSATPTAKPGNTGEPSRVSATVSVRTAVGDVCTATVRLAGLTSQTSSTPAAK